MNEKFKNELCKTTYEWVLGEFSFVKVMNDQIAWLIKILIHTKGIRPLPELHTKWGINDQIQSATADSGSNSTLSSESMKEKTNYEIK